MFDFQRIRLVAQREVRTRFKMKAYRWTLVVQVVVALLAGLSPIAISYFADDSDSGGVVLVVDETPNNFASILQPHLESDLPGMAALDVQSFSEGADAARSSVKEGDADAAVIVTEQDEGIHFEVVTNGNDGLDFIATRIQSAVSVSSVQLEAERAGLTEDEATALVAAPVISVESPSGDANSIEENFSGPIFAIVNIGLILTYTMFIMYGTWIAQGVVEEKSSRMMEIMVNAATPRDLLVGKILGVLIAGLGQVVPMMAAGGIAFALQPRIAKALDINLTSTFDLDFASISFKAVWIFLVYFILGYILFGSLFAALGSLVSRQEEVSQAVAPAMIIVVVGLMLAYFVMALPDSVWAKVLFIVPLTSPYVALARVLLGDPSPGEIALSIALLAISGLMAMLLAAKIYRTGVLMYGQKAGLLHVFKLKGQQQVAR